MWFILQFLQWRAHSAGVVEYTDCFSAEESDFPNECLDMTLKNLIVRLQ